MRQRLFDGDKADIAGFLNFYLNEAHRDGGAAGCTVAALAGDAARKSPELQAQFRKQIESNLDDLERRTGARRQQAPARDRTAALEHTLRRLDDGARGGRFALVARSPAQPYASRRSALAGAEKKTRTPNQGETIDFSRSNRIDRRCVPRGVQFMPHRHHKARQTLLRGSGRFPAWLFPLNPPGEGREQAHRTVGRSCTCRLAGWRSPRRSSTICSLRPTGIRTCIRRCPTIVLRGRASRPLCLRLLSLCPAGQGRPENAALAGLPAAYIIQQVAEIKSGARGSAWHGGPYRPIDLMRDVAANATDPDVAAAAEYFSAQIAAPPRHSARASRGYRECASSAGSTPSIRAVAMRRSASDSSNGLPTQPP